jgi:large subunit ribosomal protein L7/L12
MANLNTLVDELSSLTLLEAAELKTLLEDKWGVKAASGGGMMMMAGPAGGGAAAEAVEEQTEFNVTITDVGPKKINVIKVVRTLTDLGLKEAKDLVESAPAVVLEGASKDRAAEAKAQLEAEGAQVTVK